MTHHFAPLAVVLIMITTAFFSFLSDMLYRDSNNLLLKSSFIISCCRLSHPPYCAIARFLYSAVVIPQITTAQSDFHAILQ